MSKNNNLHTAKATKNDEFYTQLEDIENELKYYKDYFKGKVVYCNCDGFLNKEKSNFFMYFSLNYEFLGLKGLICTKYNPNGKGKKYEYYGDLNGNNYPDEEEVFTSELEGDGDFRSEECIELLKKCDIVCTNPPFSLFRQYVAQLFEYKKDFLIIGNMNAISYKEVFPMIKENKMWLGVSSFNKGMYFGVPDDYTYADTYKFDRERNGKKVMRVSSICWFTNLDHKKRHEELVLYKKYNEEEYPKYDNYDAIEVSKVTDIPMDYEGIMGVPITFLNKYCPEQFEIVDLNPHFFSMIAKGLPKPKQLSLQNVNSKDPYARVLIKRIS